MPASTVTRENKRRFQSQRVFLKDSQRKSQRKLMSQRETEWKTMRVSEPEKASKIV